MMAAVLRQVLTYLRLSVPFFVLRRPVPLVLGLVITDRCNLACRHCRVTNTGRRDMTMEEIRARLTEFRRRGYCELYIEGGEPFLWQDGPFTLGDVIAEARRAGYLHVHVYTNGTFGLDAGADFFWVSLDGTREQHDCLRGRSFDRVLTTLKSAPKRKTAIIYTVNNLNKHVIGDFLVLVRDEDLSARGVMFYFHTPYYGIDELFIAREERGRLTDKLIGFKRQGLPVLNSYAALRAFRDGTGKRPGPISLIADVAGEHFCCRYANPATCRDCGFTACMEITEAQRLRPSALATLLRFW
ncbi:MAG: radical SAM protein [bacterium]|nr:radical SAM protein [bacterium]